MDLFDFLIGFTLMNAMPHYILGVWKAKMLSGFGMGDTKNIVWGLVNFALSIGLFAYKYGLSYLPEHGMYLGALTILVTFFITSHFWYARFYKDKK